MAQARIGQTMIAGVATQRLVDESRERGVTGSTNRPLYYRMEGGAR
jgi:hypothetical protein